MTDFAWLLPLLVLWPVLGVAAVLATRRTGGALAAAAQRVSLCVLVGELLLAVVVVGLFDPDRAGFQLRFSQPWLPDLGIHYTLAVDGLSVLFLPATALLFLAVTLASGAAAGSRPRLYHALLLLQLSTTVLIYVAADTMLFFLAWELSLVPIYFLTVLWGVGPGRRFMATKYTLIMLGSGIPLLLAFLLAGFDVGRQTGGEWAFDLARLMATPVSESLQPVWLVLLILGLAAKTPMFPLHTWLPSLAQDGPVPAAALLLGFKLGAFALLRLALPLAPSAVGGISWFLAAVGVIGLLYGAVAALAQTNLRRMLAYASLSHVGLVLLGIASLSAAGVQGAVLQLLNFTWIAGGLFIVTGFIHRRVGSTDTLHLGGLVHAMPRLATVFAVFSLAALGVPGSSGFPAELLLLTASLRAFPGAGLAALFAGVIGAAYVLGALRKSFFGPARAVPPDWPMDLRPHETAAVTVLLLPILLCGLMPDLALSVIAHVLPALPLR